MPAYLTKNIKLSCSKGDFISLTLYTRMNEPQDAWIANFLSEIDKPDSILLPKIDKPDSILDFERKINKGEKFYFWEASFSSMPEGNTRHLASSTLNPSDLYFFYKDLIGAETELKRLNSHKLIADYHNNLSTSPMSISIFYSSFFKGITITLYSKGANNSYINFDERSLRVLIKTIESTFSEGDKLVKEMELISPIGETSLTGKN